MSNSVNEDKKQLALDLHNIGALKFGEFTLKSGVLSPMYMDLRLSISYPKLLKKVAKLYAGMLEDLKYDRLAGVAYAALPIAGAISLEIERPWIYMRKEGLAKGHGLKKSIEGEYKEGDVIVVIDDLVFKGDSKIEVVEPFQDHNLVIKDFAVLIDYEKGAKELLKQSGFNLHSYVTMKEVIELMKSEGKIDQKKYEQCMNFMGA